jgi:hypothetical protein
MALAMKQAGIEGCIVAVDHFLGSPEHWDMGLFDRKYGMPNLYEIFMSNVYHANVTDLIVPMAQTSVTAAQILKRKGLFPSLVHVDAAHEYEEVIRDAEEYYSILEPGGFLIGDDYHPTWSASFAEQMSLRHATFCRFRSTRRNGLFRSQSKVRIFKKNQKKRMLTFQDRRPISKQFRHGCDTGD